MAPSLDHCGPLTRWVRDAALALSVMASHDPCDPGSAEAPVADYAAQLEDGVRGMRVGVPFGFFEKAPTLTDDARQGILSAIDWLRASGAEIRAVTLPDYEHFVACGRVLMTAEAFDIHRDDLRQRLDAYGAITARRFAVGAAIVAADYIAR